MDGENGLKFKLVCVEKLVWLGRAGSRARRSQNGGKGLQAADLVVIYCKNVGYKDVIELR
jgi:hypothetical protein